MIGVTFAFASSSFSLLIFFAADQQGFRLWLRLLRVPVGAKVPALHAETSLLAVGRNQRLSGGTSDGCNRGRVALLHDSPIPAALVADHVGAVHGALHLIGPTCACSAVPDLLQVRTPGQ